MQKRCVFAEFWPENDDLLERMGDGDYWDEKRGEKTLTNLTILHKNLAKLVANQFII